MPLRTRGHLHFHGQLHLVGRQPFQEVATVFEGAVDRLLQLGVHEVKRNPFFFFAFPSCLLELSLSHLVHLSESHHGWGRGEGGGGGADSTKDGLIDASDDPAHSGALVFG